MISNIKYFSTVNGEGIRTAVFFSGCRLHCKGCFNQEAWDFNYGHKMTLPLIDKIIDSIDSPYISGLSILGGEPLDIVNQSDVYLLIRKFRDKFGDSKTIWLWTGYNIDSNVPETEYTMGIFKHVDIVVDGRFDIDKRTPDLIYRGSSNQRIIDMRKSLKQVEIVEYESK